MIKLHAKLQLSSLSVSRDNWSWLNRFWIQRYVKMTEVCLALVQSIQSKLTILSHININQLLPSKQILTVPSLYGGWPVGGGCVNSKKSSAELWTSWTNAGLISDDKRYQRTTHLLGYRGTCTNALHNAFKIPHVLLMQNVFLLPLLNRICSMF